MQLHRIAFVLAAALVLAGPTFVAPQPALGNGLPSSPSAGETTYVAYLPLVATPGSNISSGAGWPMVAANPQRTSYTNEEVPPAPVEWYRVIEPFIGLNVQPVLAATAAYPNGLLFLATSKGVYTFRADTGSTVWRFDTELPIGNSPTYAGQRVYVPGLDRRLYALQADSGAKLWEYAGAGAGFDTNPLLVEGKVILGNHDGGLYAVDAGSGQLSWKYQTGGPIRFSSAYKSGVVYTVSNDGYLYANRASDGALQWKSNPQMRGGGFNSYWPVVYMDPATNKNYVIVAGSSSYRAFAQPGQDSLSCGSYQWCEWLDEWNGNVAGTLGETVASEPWANGRQEVDFINTLSEYLADDPTPSAHYHKPWRRYFFIFDAATGQEYTMRSKSGRPTYLPVDPILSNSGNVYPPVVGKDDLLYLGNHWDANTQSRVMGWKFGTSKMVIQGLQQAGDEPSAFSAGGNLIYRSLTNDRVGDSVSVTGRGGGSFWTYDLGSPEKAPGYDAMWWFPGSPDSLARLFGNYGGLPNTLSGGSCNNLAGTGNCSVNGVYSEHGDQRPLVPFMGRVYSIASNALIAWGPAGGNRQLPKLTAVATTTGPDYGIGVSELRGRLENEVAKIVAAGRLRPGYYNAGQFNDTYPSLLDYFSSPGDTIYALSRAYPYLSSGLQAQVKVYLQTEFANLNALSWQGAAREWLPTAPEVLADMQTAPAGGQIDAYYIYGLWKYAQNVAPENAGAILATANSLRSVNSNLGGLGLSAAANNRNTAGAVAWNGLNGGSTLVATCNWFVKDTPWTTEANYTKRTLNISRNFLYMVPEVADCLRRNSAVTSAMREYEWLAPYWFVARYTGSVAESTNQNLYDYASMFAAKAYIERLPREQLVKYLDVAAFQRGDLFYIQNLVTTIEAPSGSQASVTQSASEPCDQ